MNRYIFKILRFNPEKDKKARFAEYQVPLREGSTVLDGLFYIHKQVDPSLSFRFSCRGSVCGSCAMNINDSHRLACETQVKNLGSSIKIMPLRHLPVIKDLVVDMERFWQSYESIKPYLVSNSVNDKENIVSPAERKRLDGLIECILCGLCFGSCPVTALNENYLGPHALLKHTRFTEDLRDEYKGRLKTGVKKEGVWGCRNVFNCQEVCPKNLSPARAIIKTKLKVTRKKF
ncbi:MAG: succinate dehydrogenase iron-sulfur subunit [Nitrospirae bacterium]|nr:succinate dehydrogenase iron-sulfur subunit [Nitrospirota bacterium]